MDIRRFVNVKSTQTFLFDYGQKSFDELSFCDADAFVLCEIFYMPFENVVSPSFADEPVDFYTASQAVFNSRHRKHKGIGVIMFTHQPSNNMMRVANAGRYRGMKIAALKSMYCKSPAIQFCAGTFILPDGTILVNYRGTDDTIAGWKEDFDIFLTKGTPSHHLAVEYLNAAADAYDGDIIVIGHSKGGNMALFSALHCKPEVRKRIKSVYNNDGPGFYDHEFVHSEKYKEIEPNYHHFVPRIDIVGMCMANDYDYDVIKTFSHFPPVQHYIGNWQLSGGNAIVLRDTSSISKIYDAWNSTLAAKIERGYADAVETVFDVVSVGFGINTLTDAMRHPISTVKNGKEAWDSISPETKEKFTQAFDGGFDSLVSTIKMGKDIDNKRISEEAFNS